MGLLHPLGVSPQGAHRIVDAGQPQFLDALGREVAVQVVDLRIGDQLLEGQAGVDREGDDVGAFQHAVSAQRPDDLLRGKVLPVEVRERFHFEDQPRVGFRGHQFEVGIQRGDVLRPVGEHDLHDLPGRGLFHVDVGALVDAVVVDDQPVVGREPDVDLRTVDADRIGLGERRQRILGRTRSRPVTAVCDDFGLCQSRSARQQQGGGEDEVFSHIVLQFGCVLVKRNLCKGSEYFRNYNPKPAREWAFRCVGMSPSSDPEPLMIRLYH